MSTFKPDLVVPQEWVGVDFNRTLAEYHSYHDDMALARPILPMLEFVKQLLAQGVKVKIMSAQVWTPTDIMYAHSSDPRWKDKDLITQAQGYMRRAKNAERVIKNWCRYYLGQELEVTCERDPGCMCVYDDKARQVIRNTGFVPYLSTEPHPFEHLRLTFQDDFLSNDIRPNAHPSAGFNDAAEPDQP